VKNARKRILMGLLLAVSVIARPQSIITNRPALTDRGHVEGLTYSNATLGFSYQLPQGFFVNPLPDNLPSGSLLLMTADTHNGTPWRDRIVLIADDAGKYSWATSEYVTHFGRSMPAKLQLKAGEAQIQNSRRWRVGMKTVELRLPVEVNLHVETLNLKKTL
jgi:hypothetical protein